jgi:hypothetical protein
MKCRISYYVVTSGDVIQKLGSEVTVKDGRKKVVRDEIGKALGIDGWNLVVVNGDKYEEGPGPVKGDIEYFNIDRYSNEMYMKLKASEVPANFVAPRIPGFKYVVPELKPEDVKPVVPVVPAAPVVPEVTEENVWPEAKKIEEKDEEVDGAGEADSNSEGVQYTEAELKKLKKEELVAIVGDDESKGKTKEELISIILKK